MGEMADWEIDRAMGLDDEAFFSSWFHPPHRSRKSFQKGIGNFKWRQADGSVVDMRSMSTQHILNALRMCESRGNTGKGEQFKQVLAERANEGADAETRGHSFSHPFPR